MADIKAGTYSPETARIIWEVVQYIRRNPSLLKSGHQPEPVQEIPCVMLAKVTEEVTARDTDDLGIGVAALQWVPGEAGTAVAMEEYPEVPAAEVDLYNATESTVAVDTVLPIVREFGSGKWIAVTGGDPSQRIAATITNGNTFEEETASDPHTAGTITGINKAYTGAATINVYNPLKIKLWNGIKIFAEWNVTDEQWQVYAATSERVLHHVQHTEDCNLEALNGRDGWYIFSDAEWVTSVTVDGCEIRYSTTCNDNILAGEMDYITSFENQYCNIVGITCKGNEVHVADLSRFVTAVYKSGDALYYQTCAGTNVTILPFSDCGEVATCGTCSYVATMVGEVLQWVATDSCGGTCECVAPPVSPVVPGQTWTTNCEEP